MNPDEKGRLKEIILKYSYEQRDVTLASGKKSNFYFDGKQTTLHPEGGYLVAKGMLEIIRDHFPQAQAVGGPTLGADPIVSNIGALSWQIREPLQPFIVRKAPKGHGTLQWIEGVKHLKSGMRTVLVEDVITTGGSLIKAAGKVEASGLQALGVVVLVDREEGGKENIEATGLKVYSLFKKSELVSS